MEEIVRISGKNQIVVPKKVRKKLGVGPGDELIIEMEKERAIITPRPKSYTNYLLGLGKEIWGEVEAAQYVETEREAWERKQKS